MKPHPSLDSLRIGVVGAGAIFLQRHLPGLHAIPGVKIVAVANSTPARSRAVCEKHLPDARPEESWETLVAANDIDIVWISTTPWLHEPVTVAALQAGKHVFCQARMARDFQEALRMAAAARSSPELVTALCPPPYGLAEDAFVHRLLAEHRAGNIHHLRLRSLNGAFADPSKPSHWRQQRENSGNNVLTLGIFVEVLQRWFGDVSSVSAHRSIRYPVRPDGIVQIPDVLDVIASFGDELLSSWHFSGIHGGHPVNDLEICGDTGCIHIDFDSGKIHLRNQANQEQLLPLPGELRPWRVEADFIDAIRNPALPRPIPGFSEGLAYMRVVDAVHEASLSHRRIQVPTPNAGLPE